MYVGFVSRDVHSVIVICWISDVTISLIISVAVTGLVVVVGVVVVKDSITVTSFSVVVVELIVM